MDYEKTPLSLIVKIVLSIFLAASLCFNCQLASSPFNITADLDYTSLLNALNMTAVEEHVKFLSKTMYAEFNIPQTRAIGYPGNELASQYIHDFFVRNGLINVSYQTFTIVDVINHGANITIEGMKTIMLYPILPNLVCPSTTPSEGLLGHVIFAGDGYIEDFDGLEVEGSIVLMNWNTLNRWINAAKLGAKAVIFLPPSNLLLDNNYVLSEEGYMYEKYLPTVPFNFPRFYVNGTDADVLLNNEGVEAKIVSTQRWEKLTSQNVLGYVMGKNSDNIIVVSSYYDSYSYSPCFAPGAQEATGISSLLEIAKYLAKPENKPENTILFVAFSGHSMCCQGAYIFYRDYRSWHAVGGPNEAIGDKIKFSLNLDFPTGSNASYITAYGGLGVAAGYKYSQASPENYYETIPLWSGTANLVQSIVHGLIEDNPAYEVGLGSHLAGEGFVAAWEGQYRSWKNLPFESEWALPSLSSAFTITTAHDPRPVYWTPFDTYERVNFRNLETLIQVANVLVNGFADANSKTIKDAAFPENLPLRKPVTGDPRELGPTAAAWGISTGRVTSWSIENPFIPVPNAIFAGLIGGGVGSDTRDTHKWTPYRKFIITDQKGNVWQDEVEKGIYTMAGGSLGPSFISAWVLNETTGNIVMAPDHGIHLYTSSAYLGSAHWPSTRDYGVLSIFNASTLVLFDIPMEGVELPVQFPDQSPLTEYGSWGMRVDGGASVYGQNSLVRIVAVPPNTTFQYIWKTGYDRYPRLLLINASRESPSGQGYVLKSGEQLTVYMTQLEIAEDFYWLNEERFQSLSRIDPSILASKMYVEHMDTWKLIQSSKENLANHTYSKAESCATQALILSKSTYDNLRTTIEDAAYTVPYIAVFFIPFVYLAERVLFAWRGIKRIVSLLSLFAFLIATFYPLHPGFSLATSTTMIIIGFTILFLSFPLFIIILLYVSAHLRAIRLARMGKHEREVTAFTGLGNAFLTGTEQMRRYRLRSALTLTSIIIMVGGIVSLTSISSIQTVEGRYQANAVASYQGLYVHKPQWGGDQPGIPDSTITMLLEKFGKNSVFVPRAWLYEINQKAWAYITHPAGFYSSREEASFKTRVLWGLTPQDFEVNQYLIAGRWFLEREKGVVVLNEEQAESLGINATDVDLGKIFIIYIETMPHKVIGIIRNSLGLAVSLDGEKITPLKHDFPPATPNTYTTHLDLDDCLILPYDEVMDFGGRTASLSIQTSNATFINEVKDWLVRFMNYPVDLLTFTCIGGTVLVNSGSFVVQAWGVENMIIPMLIVFLSVFNILLASVHERRRDIGTYSAIGLSPTQVSFMFLAESLTYAVLGGVLGFIFSMVMARTANTLSPGILALNFSSKWVMISIGYAVITTTASSIYPMLLASRLVTPSLERAWTVSTKPVGDMWEIPLPFYAPDAREAEGILKWINEYLNAHILEDSPDFHASNVHLAEGETEGRPYKIITSEIRFFPYDSGVTQTSSLQIVQVAPERWQCHIILNRTGGTQEVWTSLNRRYLDLFRKQLLMWRSLKPEERERYMKLY